MNIPDSVSPKIFQYLSVHNTRLAEGDVFAGRVLAVDGNLLLMQLFDGREISARIDTDAKYNPGDLLKLKVVDQQQGKLIAKEMEHFPVKNDAAFEDAGNSKNISDTQSTGNLKDISNPKNLTSPIKILKSLNLPVNKVSIEIVNSIFEMGEKPSEQLIEKALGVIEKMPEESPKQAVFLALNQLEDKEQYCSLLKELDEGKFHFAEELNNLVDLLENADDENLSAMAGKIRSAFRSSLVKSSFLHEKISNENIPEKPPENIKEEPLPNGNDIPDSKPSKIVKNEEAALPKVDQWLKELEKDLDSVRKIVVRDSEKSVTGSEKNSGREKILSTVDKLQTAISFFDEISSFDMFVQLPLIYKGAQAKGELYVMKRKGNRGKIDSRDFSVFLSLSTENIGDLDIFVHVKNKNVMVKVQAENDTFRQLIISEYKTLYDALKEKGYNLVDLGFAAENEKVSVFNAEKRALMLLGENKTKIDIKV